MPINNNIKIEYEYINSPNAEEGLIRALSMLISKDDLYEK